MAVLVLLEHEAAGIKQPSRSAVAAAAKLGEVHGLVLGEGIGTAAQAAARLPGLSKVLACDSPAFAHLLAEPVADLLVRLVPGYSHQLRSGAA
jgi:electron transfer flavoprotein alpha subunit